MIIEKLLSTQNVPHKSTPPQQLIGELGVSLGLEPKTIRFYESVGLLTPSRLGRFRVYGNNDMATLSLVKFLRSHDLPISSIRKIIALSKSQGSQDSADVQVAKLLGEQIERLKTNQKKIDASIQKLSELLSQEFGEAQQGKNSSGNVQVIVPHEVKAAV